MLPNINYPYKYDGFRSQRWDKFFTAIPVTREPDGTYEEDFHILNIVSAEQTIMVSQVDTALGDEAEAGRIHGMGKLFCGLWENGNIRINLHEQWYPCGGYLPSLKNDLSFPTGQPLMETIDTNGMVSIANATSLWDTQFAYLRMSTGIFSASHESVHWSGCTKEEFVNTIVLQKKFGLSGRWGGKNRISEKSNWYEDKTLLNYPDDTGWTREFVSNSEGIPLHSIIWRNNGDLVVILPEMILRRPGFDFRRVFMAPETIHYPIKRGKGFSGTINVTLSLPKQDLESDDYYFCYPGGANAVDICDLTLLYRADKINLLILNKQGAEGWKFAMRFAVRLRKEHISFSIKLLTGDKCEELSLKKFRKHLLAQALIVPEELNDDFGGSLNAYLECKHPDLIPGFLGKGEVMTITGEHTAEVAFYMATTVRSGCWNGRWWAVKRSCKVTLFADKYSLARIEKTKIPAGVDIRSGDIQLADAKAAVRECGLVIFASQAMQNDKTRFHELLKFCLNQDISAIVFAEKQDAFILQLAGQRYTLNCQLDGETCQYRLGSATACFGVKFCLTSQGQLASCSDLDETDLNQLCCDDREMAQVSNGIENIVNASQEQIISNIFSV